MKIYKQQMHKYCGGAINLYRAKEGYVFVCEKCKHNWTLNVNGGLTRLNLCKEWRDIKKEESN